MTVILLVVILLFIASASAIVAIRVESSRPRLKSNRYAVVLTEAEAKHLLQLNSRDVADAIFDLLESEGVCISRRNELEIVVNWTAEFIPPHQRVLTIERVKEIKHETTRRIESLKAKIGEEGGL